MTVHRADGLALQTAEAIARYESRGSGFHWRAHTDTLLFAEAPSPASCARLESSAASIRLQGIRAWVSGDSLRVDILWCPTGATPGGRLALIEAFASARRDECLRDRRKRDRADAISGDARQTFSAMTFARLASDATRHLPRRYWPVDVEVREHLTADGELVDVRR